MINLVGGYGSEGFWILVLSLLFVGSVLNVIGNLVIKVIGLGLFIWGGVELVGFIDYTVKTTPNLPEYANVFSLLFAIIVFLVVFKMMWFNYPTKKKKGSSGAVASSKEALFQYSHFPATFGTGGIFVSKVGTGDCPKEGYQIQSMEAN